MKGKNWLEMLNAYNIIEHTFKWIDRSRDRGRRENHNNRIYNCAYIVDVCVCICVDVCYALHEEEVHKNGFRNQTE